LDFKFLKGISLIEIIVGSAIISLILLSLGSVAQFSLYLTEKSLLRMQAVFLASEGIEAIKTIRDTSWSSRIANLTSGTNYYLTFSTNHFETTISPPALIDGVFQRRIVLEDVYRDANSDITTLGGTLDSETKKLNMYVSWTHRNSTNEEVIRTYLTDIFDN